jgi:RHS repeat-associated protein
VVGTDNRLLSDGTYCYLYDGEGNCTVRFKDADHNFSPESPAITGGDTEITAYTWDHRNRLASVSYYASTSDYSQLKSTSCVAYSYDYLNRQIRRAYDSDGSKSTTASITCDYNVYDGDHPLFDYTDSDGLASGVNGSATHWYLYGPAVDQILADEKINTPGHEGDTRFALCDQQGTVRDVIDSSATGTVLDHIKYDPFGNITAQTTASGNTLTQADISALDFIFGYDGRPLGRKTGLYNFLNRVYDPMTARFMSEDPTAFGGGDYNFYRYCGNDPMDQTDPTGLCSGYHGVDMYSQFAPSVSPISLPSFGLSNYSFGPSYSSPLSFSTPIVSPTTPSSSSISSASGISSTPALQKISLINSPAWHSAAVGDYIQSNYSRGDWGTGVIDAISTAQNMGVQIPASDLVQLYNGLQARNATLDAYTAVIRNPGPKTVPQPPEASNPVLEQAIDYLCGGSSLPAGYSEARNVLMPHGGVRTAVDRYEFPIDADAADSIFGKAWAISGPHAAASPWAPYPRNGNLLDNVQSSLDIIGTFDPTPITDSINGVVSAFRGNYGSAGVSLASALIPYAGDTLKAGKVVLTGQLHHVISKKVFRELEEHATLAGKYALRDARLTTMAADEVSHTGYQMWHRELDAEVQQWLKSPQNANATTGQFESWLNWRYGQPDMKRRFPNGLDQ